MSLRTYTYQCYAIYYSDMDVGLFFKMMNVVLMIYVCGVDLEDDAGCNVDLKEMQS